MVLLGSGVAIVIIASCAADPFSSLLPSSARRAVIGSPPTIDLGILAFESLGCLHLKFLSRCGCQFLVTELYFAGANALAASPSHFLDLVYCRSGRTV
jgi:hypothetical protein